MWTAGRILKRVGSPVGYDYSTRPSDSQLRAGSSIEPMPDLKQRVTMGILGLALTFSLVACESDDNPANTTLPTDSDTTAPIGS